MRISDWSSDVCSSDLLRVGGVAEAGETNEIAAELRGDVVVRHIRQLAQDQTQHHGKGRSLFQSAAAGMPRRRRTPSALGPSPAVNPSNSAASGDAPSAALYSVHIAAAWSSVAP